MTDFAADILDAAADDYAVERALWARGGCPCGCIDHVCDHDGWYVCDLCPPEKGCHGTGDDDD